jgi:uncharacterized protein YcbX
MTAITMRLAAIYIYPIKSCQGIRLDRAEVTPKGFAWDREFMLVDREGKFITQRQYAQLARIQVQLVEGGLLLSTADNRISPFFLEPSLTGAEMSVQIWRDRTAAIDQGDEVANWFQTALQLPVDRPCRLVRQSSHVIRPIDPNYAERDDEPVSFADGYPFLLTATASLAELNRRLQEADPRENQTVPMNRFRPNIVVETEIPFSESHWRSIQIGEVKFAVVKPCSRCIITTTDQITGERNPQQEPLRTLSTFRQFGKAGIMFGENMIPKTIGQLKVGDRVQIFNH